MFPTLSVTTAEQHCTVIWQQCHSVLFAGKNGLDRMKETSDKNRWCGTTYRQWATAIINSHEMYHSLT